VRYIQKTTAPNFFIDTVEGLTNWNEYTTSKKPLRKFILENEQNYLCVYCESKISSDKSSSHIEHIRPKAQDKYPQFTFEYNNLVVSCNGTCYNQENDTHNNSCGHIKENRYNEDNFLNPVEIKDIRDYFIYDFDEYTIESSQKNSIKSSYMIDTLQLNYIGLKIARKKALKNFIQKMKTIKNITIRKEKIKYILNQEKLEQISFLRYKYKQLLK
jgi:uncharacterized protein (TIGR02646 family)